MSRTYEAGIATAYGAALRGGYTGTYDEYCRAQADFAGKADLAIQSAQRAADCANSAANSRDSAAASMTSAAASEQAASQCAAAARSSADSAASSAQTATAAEARAVQVRTSIPDDYTALCGRVSELDAKLMALYPTVTVGPEAIASLPDAVACAPDALRFEIAPVQAGSGDPAANNVRPIQAHTALKVLHTGRNLLTGMRRSRTEFNGITYIDNGDGSIHARGTATSNAYSDFSISQQTLEYSNYPLLPPGTYVIPTPNTPNITYYVSLWDMDLNQVGGNLAIHSDTSLSRRTFTLTSPCWAYFRLQVPIGVTVDDDAFPALYRQGYEGEWSKAVLRQWEITFPQAAGEVFAGWVDAAIGKLYVLPAYASYAGEALAGPWVSDRDVYAPGTSPTAGAQVVDLGGTPAVYDLELPEIAPVRGFNHLWCDTGDTTITYRADAYDRLYAMIVGLKAMVQESQSNP